MMTCLELYYEILCARGLLWENIELILDKFFCKVDGVRNKLVSTRGIYWQVMMIQGPQPLALFSLNLLTRKTLFFIQYGRY